MVHSFSFFFFLFVQIQEKCQKMEFVKNQFEQCLMCYKYDVFSTFYVLSLSLFVIYFELFFWKKNLLRSFLTYFLNYFFLFLFFIFLKLQRGLIFQDGKKVLDTEGQLKTIATQLQGFKSAFEYIQDYVSIYGLKMWQEEFSRIVSVSGRD